MAIATGLSRRAADRIISEGKVHINGRLARLGDEAGQSDEVSLDGQKLSASAQPTTIMLNKPTGYVCSRRGQGSKTIYELLPAEYHRLKPVGRLDKESSGLILLTDDGQLANQLTHPRYQKEKIYNVQLDKKLAKTDKNQVLTGIELEDGLSKFIKLNECSTNTYEVVLGEGRNRQIRRTFAALGYEVTNLHRTHLGPYTLDRLEQGSYKIVY